MRTIERSTRFKKDFKLVAKQIGAEKADKLLSEALGYLVNDRPLPAKFRDHSLTNAGDLRDCHLRPDLVLLYEKAGTDTLRLVRLGSHSDLWR